MTAILADPVSEVVAAAERLLTRRTGATVTLVDPIDLGGSGRTIVLRVRVAENPFSLPRTLVLKQYGAVEAQGSENAFLREVVSYQFATALATESRPGAELLASDLPSRLLVLTDLGDSTPFAELVGKSDHDTVTNTLMAMAQALGRMHAATVGREEDFTALLRRAEVAHYDDAIASQVDAAVESVPQLLSDMLGVTVSDEVRAVASRAAKLFRSGGFRAFSSADLCPDNIIVNDEGVRFLDYEWGGFRDALLDIAYARVSFPGCLCSIELSQERADAMADAWRAEVVGMWPALADDDVLAARLAEAELIWVWFSTWMFLPGEGERVAAVRDHTLSVPRIEALQRRWAQVAMSAERAGNAAVAHHATEVAARLAD
ncbi:phosphotransferase [Rhodococcus sp. HNM0569]|uniref:phosphotransferase family protein n=1 Tax=Rhodococcus sp. HNM0569 TaxID=2716340 RepID=UPI00146A4EEE|nr:phosphotransferase [Rhodococcus sp. HNM0569]NLU81277.1 phosphotransferase [Rhodococcus sp. HNM0569]